MPIINPAAQSQLALTLHSVHEPEPEPEQQAISTEVGKVGELHVSFPGTSRKSRQWSPSYRQS